MSATSVCLSDRGWNATAAARSSAPRSKGPLRTGSWSAPAREPSSSCSTSQPTAPGQRAGEPLHRGDRGAQLVACGGEEKVLGVLFVLGRGHGSEVDDPLVG